MRPFKYQPPRVGNGDLRTPITFFEYMPNEGPEPGEKEKRVLYTAWAKIDQVWLKDLEQAKANKTLSDVTITIRNPLGTYIPTNHHYISIQARGFEPYRYNVEHVQYDSKGQFMTIVGRRDSWE